MKLISLDKICTFSTFNQEIKEAEELQKARESTEEQFKDILDNSRNIGQQIDWL